MKLLHHGSSRYRPDQKLGPACWPHYDLLVVLSGGFHFDRPEAGLTAVAGDALIVPRGVPFQGWASTDGGTLWVHHFKSGRTASERWLTKLPKERLAYFSGGAASVWAHALLTRIHEIHSLPEMRGEQTGLLKLLLDHIRRSPAEPKPTVIRRAVDHASSRHWKGVTVAGMARDTGMSQSHFRARFLKEMGETPGRFLKLRRLEWAREILQATDTPIKEISREAGYNEVSAFYHAFRKFAGDSPARFRKRGSRLI